MNYADDAALIREAEARWRRGERKALEDIYIASRRIALSMICRQASSKGFKLSEEQAEAKAHDAAACIASRYLAQEGFTMKKPQGYIWLRVIHELFHRKKDDRAVEFRSLEELDALLSRQGGGA